MEKFIQDLNEKYGDSWTTIEWFMKINGEKYNSSYFDICGKYIEGSNFYRIGRLLTKDHDSINFITYTLENNIITLNHESNHSLDGTYKSGMANCFGLGVITFSDTEDALDYIAECIPDEDPDSVN